MGKSYKLEVEGMPVKGKIDEADVAGAVSALLQRECEFIILQSPRGDFLQAAWIVEDCLTVEYHGREDEAVFLRSDCRDGGLSAVPKIFTDYFKAEAFWKDTVKWQRVTAGGDGRGMGLKVLPMAAAAAFLLCAVSFSYLPHGAWLAVVGVSFFVVYIMFINYVFLVIMPGLKERLEEKFRLDIQEAFWTVRDGREDWLIETEGRYFTKALVYLLYYAVVLCAVIAPVAGLVTVMMMVGE